MIGKSLQALKTIAIAAPLLVNPVAQAAKVPPSHVPQDIKPLLGFVVLDHTTLGEFVSRLEAQGCSISYDNGVAQVDSGCVQLPGEPKIRAITSLKKDDKAVPWESLDSLKKMPSSWTDLPIESLALFTRNYKAWKDYLESLSNSWGAPTKTEGYDGSSGSVAVWKKNRFEVELKRVSGYTWITYISKNRLKRLEEARLAHEKITQENLNLL